MKPFRFEPELFEHRTTALEAMGREGFDCLSHYSAVDVLHEVYGLEVCGIKKEADARKIEKILHQAFPKWRHSHIGHRRGNRDPGWVFVIHRDEEADWGCYTEG